MGKDEVFPRECIPIGDHFPPIVQVEGLYQRVEQLEKELFSLRDNIATQDELVGVQEVQMINMSLRNGTLN